MKKFVSIIVILGFVAIDFLFFHDLFKPGEVTTLPQYLTGLLSLLVFALCFQNLMAHGRRLQA